ncbi:hypothetical protein H8N03_19210 [Ramlibacter sp. USB13]|uniref:DUF4198 domain-containing protein n=1 Tax=Ramlibacter cellulosilyticus TaxID=2764187 RepID=A0A923MUW1_9BURK|nr:hypothetical protein [Ramlibacter cellulosilyticus]MBC5785084.1 hypothetical protein [Ramlibacter cellulosilyticus]
MKNQLRSQAAAAAVLLASLGAAFVASPAHAHATFTPHHHSAQELIQRFELIGPPTRGVKLVYRVTGMPGSYVSIRVPTYPQEIDLKEVQPGVYEVDYVIAPNEDPRNVLQAVARIRAQDDQALARLGTAAYLAPGTVAVPVPPQRDNRVPPPPVRETRDTRAPDIANLLPAQGQRVSERGQTRIAADFRDDRAGVDRNSVRLRVDGRDVTRDARIDDDGIQYRDDLRPGRHTAELTVRDRAGNATRKSWTFDVVDWRPGNGWGDRNHDRGWDRDRDWRDDSRR